MMAQERRVGERTDTERLDALERREAKVHCFREHVDDGWAIWWRIVKRGRSISGHPRPSLRAAIDEMLDRESEDGTNDAR